MSTARPVVGGFVALTALGRLAIRVPGPMLAYLGAFGPLLYPFLGTPVVFYILARVIGPPIPPVICALLGLIVVLFAYAGQRPRLLTRPPGRRGPPPGARVPLPTRRCARAPPVARDVYGARLGCRCPGDPAEALQRSAPGSRGATPSSRASARRGRPRPSPPRLASAGRPGPDDMGEPLDALRRRLGAHSAGFREHPTEAGVIVASFGTEPLPQREDAPGQRDPDEIPLRDP